MKLQKTRLENGLTILFEERNIPVTTVMWATNFGAAFEKEEEKGIAHYIEHMCFKGTPTRTTEDIAESIEGIGGELNAFTHEEITAYHAKVPAEHTALATEVLADIFFNATFPEEEVEKEGKVICEEITMYQDNPRATVLDNIKQELYGTPFGMNIAGTKKTVQAITREQLQKKHKEVYTPNNAVLCVVGKTTFEEIKKLAEQHSPKEKKEITQQVELHKKEAQQKTDTRTGINQANIALAYDLGEIRHHNRHSIELLSVLLGEGMSSKLFKEVREKRGLVYGIKSDTDIGKHYGYFLIWAGTEPNNIEQVIELSTKEYQKLTNITEKELEQTKKKLLGGRTVDEEDSNHTATELIFEELTGKGAEEHYNYEKHINNVTIKDIQNLVKETTFSSYTLKPRE